LSLCGYPPEDLLYKKHFLKDTRRAIEQFAADCPDITIVAGFAEEREAKIYNAAAVLRGGRINEIYRKGMLPNYGVFDEQRYFHPGGEPVLINVKDVNIVITICFDIWNTDWLRGFLEDVGRIDMVLNISASPFHLGKIKKREQIVSRCAKEVGGQDELIFDGRSMFADSTGNVVAKARAFDEDLLMADVLGVGDGAVRVEPVRRPASQPGDLLDYTCKNGFKRVVLGLSGGIDSSVTAAVAVAALGAENVVGISMPSRFNSAETRSDAEELAKNLGIEFHTIPIEPMLREFDGALGTLACWNSDGLAYENLQARIRGCILMSLSNQAGLLVARPPSGMRLCTAIRPADSP